MHTNRNKVRVNRCASFTSDKLLKSLPVDQFPVKDFNMNRFGFPKSDITILDELSRSSSVDMNLFNAFAARISVLRSEPRNNKSVEQLIHEFRPSWIQTVSEEMEFAKWYHDKFDSVPSGFADTDQPSGGQDSVEPKSE